MALTVHTVLLVVACILFAVAAFGVASRINLVAAGLLCFALAFIF